MDGSLDPGGLRPIFRQTIWKVEPLGAPTFRPPYKGSVAGSTELPSGVLGGTRPPVGFFYAGVRRRFRPPQPTPTEVIHIKEQRVRVNDQIRISPIRLIDDDGSQVGIIALDEARQRATDKGLDLVEVAPDARPPVCKLMDYGKYKYEAARQAREAKKKQHVIQVKEVKFRPGIEDHDYDFKLRHARRFLEEGNKVKVTMMFRGRQMSHPEIGVQVLERVSEDLVELGKVESNPIREGRTMSMIIAPLSTK